MSACCYVGCDRPVDARGMCSTHYMQKRRAGLLPVGTRSHAPVEERFWRQVKKTPGCWEWMGKSKDHRGYGQIGMGGKGAKQELVHRFSYTLHKGQIPDGLVVMHACDNPRCVNPDHLSVGTKSENTLDAVRKGRWKAIPPLHCGEDQHSSKLTAEAVRLIRDNPQISTKELAIRYGTNVTSIQKVRSRKTWKHLP